MKRFRVWGVWGLILVMGLTFGCAQDLSTKPSAKSRSRLPQQASPREPATPPIQSTPNPTEPIPTESTEVEPVPGEAPRTTASLPPPVSRGFTPPADLSKLPLMVNHRDGSEMVRVPAGMFLVTLADSKTVSDFGGQAQLERVTLPAFYIDRLEITVAQFKRFQPKYLETVYTEGKECPQCPAMGVTLAEATEYCLWAGKRLPTEPEWEAAARGGTSQPYPWGTSWEAKRANLAGTEDGQSGPAPVGTYPLGAGIYGAEDMVGNVWEWVVTEPVASPTVQPVGTKTGPSNTPETLGLVKGGGYRSPPRMAVLSSRNRVPVTMRNPTFGFRCVQSG